MPTLLNRDIRLNAGGLTINSRGENSEKVDVLRAVFNVDLTLAKDANKATIVFYNLKEESRSYLQGKEEIETLLEVGYRGEMHQIFQGSLTYGASTKQGVDWVTTIQAGDGADKINSARISKSFKRIKVKEILKELAEEIDLGLGNTDEAVADGAQRGEVDAFENGVVLHGKVYDKIEQIAKQMGYEVSTQNGKLLFLRPGQVIPGKTVVLRAPQDSRDTESQRNTQLIDRDGGTGLIGSPEIGDKGFVFVRSLIQPGLVPGALVRLQSDTVSGDFKIQKCVYSGDTWGTDWYVDVEGKPI